MAAETQDLYRLLGVSREAPEREIKQAYYELARKLHPDKAATPEDAARNASDLAAISRAYNILKDKTKRADYDAGLKSRPGGAQVAAPSGPRPAGPATAPASTPPAAANVASGAAAPTRPPTEMATTGPQGGPSQGGSSAAVLAQRKTMAQKAFVRGMQAFKMADFKGAVGFFQAAAEYDPESEPQYHLKLAQSLMKSRGSFTKAIEHAERACEMDPYKVEFKIVLAEVHETVGALSKAREIYEDVLRWDGNNQQAKLQIQLLDERMGPQDKSPLVRKIKTLINKYSKKK